MLDVKGFCYFYINTKNDNKTRVCYGLVLFSVTEVMTCFFAQFCGAELFA